MYTVISNQIETNNTVDAARLKGSLSATSTTVEYLSGFPIVSLVSHFQVSLVSRANRGWQKGVARRRKGRNSRDFAVIGLKYQNCILISRFLIRIN